MKYPVCVLLLGLCVISACKKNSLPSAGGNTLNKTVSTLSANSSWQVTDSFVYDGQHRLVQVIRSIIDPAVVSDTTTFQYDGSGRVASWTESVSGQGGLVKYLLSYDGGGRLIKALSVSLRSNYAFSDYTFTYNTAGQMIVDTVYAQHLADSASPGITNYDVWTYDKNGNAVSDQGFVSSNGNLIGAPFKASGTDSYQYDNHVNPYYNLGIPLFSAFGNGPQLLSPNNLVVVTSTDPNSISPTRFSFGYYNNDRPRVQTVSVSASSGMQTQTTDYFYQ